MIEFRTNLESLIGDGVGDEVNDHFMTDERSSSPVLSDVAEHAMFNFVPLAGTWREMTDTNGHLELIGEFL